jgi:signal transduction protein with GAF and PtsI domain
LGGRLTIKTENVFSAIREINETLSLTNEPDKLVNTALDTFAQALKLDCCWIQTLGDRKQSRLTLAAERGFTPEIRAEIGAMDLGHSFSEQTIGLGHKIVIPDLSNDGLYGLPSFKTAGYRWLVAAPMMTYRAYGILGAASRNRRLPDKDTADLIMVIAGMIAAGLSKSYLAARPTEPEKPAEPASSPVEPIAEIQTVVKEPPLYTPTAPDSRPDKKPVKKADARPRYHPRKVESFRKLHG